MDYELAKQLKDAGWSQSRPGLYVYSKGLTRMFNEGSDVDSKVCYVPILSELIESCGDRFKELRQFLDGSGFITR